MTDAVGRLRAITAGQHGAFSIEQALAAGVPAAVLRGWDRSGLLRSTGVRSYRSALVPEAPLADLAGLVVDVRPELWFAHDTAASLIGFEGFVLEPPYHVVVRRGTLFRRPGVRTHTSQVLEPADLTRAHSLPVTSAVRTLIDLAPKLPRTRLTTILDGAIRDRLLVEDRLVERIAQLRTSGRYGIPKLLEVLDGAEPSRGGHSWLERRYLELTAGAGLPRPTVQVVVGRVDRRDVRVDCRYPGTTLVVELLGYWWHRTKAQMQRDAVRMNRMVLDGLTPLQFTYDDLALRGDLVVATVREALQRFV